MEHTASVIEADILLIPSLLKVFAMFQMHLFYDKENKEEKFMEAIYIKCSNCCIRISL